ncbi:MAG: hypothetical protein GXN92_02440 [Candidatus Micrarchaeota archaeon]|nr:hypothetical protein [Candidatus Micrarchaeota archaeon]
MELSKLYGMEVFTDTGKFLGTVQELIIDVEKGYVVRLLLEPLPTSKDKAAKVLKEKSILYDHVASVADVIVVKKQRTE